MAELSRIQLLTLAARMNADTVREQHREIVRLRSENARLKQRLIRAANEKRKGNRRAD